MASSPGPRGIDMRDERGIQRRRWFGVGGFLISLLMPLPKVQAESLPQMDAVEYQLTEGPGGRLLTNAGVWSPDSEWIVYDTRSDPSGSAFDGRHIEMVNLRTREVRMLYESTREAHCGVVTFHPREWAVVFIHGPENPTPDWQYCAWHRRGVVLELTAVAAGWRPPHTSDVFGDNESIGSPAADVTGAHQSAATVASRIWNLDARDIVPPFTPGALRGGSHVHVWDGAGEWVSFTYEDHVLAQLSASGPTRDVNQRNVGVSFPLHHSQPRVGTDSTRSVTSLERGHDPMEEKKSDALENVPANSSIAPIRPSFGTAQSLLMSAATTGLDVTVKPDHPRNHDGKYFTVLVTRTAARPLPGSDEISRAFEEAWVGANGYLRADGQRQKHALAFQGNVVTSEGDTISEVFIADLPEDLTIPGEGLLAGTETRMPYPPKGVAQRRLTFTADRHFPGLQGPRHWLRSSPDGAHIAFLMKDDDGVVQLWTISPNGGLPRQLTSNSWPVASAFTWSPNGRWIAHVMDNSICVTDAATGETIRLNPRSDEAAAPRQEACVFSPDGGKIAYIRRMPSPVLPSNQIFILTFER